MDWVFPAEKIAAHEVRNVLPSGK